jgi:hypothetical protein
MRIEIDRKKNIIAFISQSALEDFALDFVWTNLMAYNLIITTKIERPAVFKKVYFGEEI